MAVREGYKTTELGVIPEDWNTLPLCALSTMKSGEGITSSRINEHSIYPCYGGNGLRGYTSEYTHEGKYVLIGRQGALCGNVVAVQGKFFASEHAVVVTPNATTDISWLKYLLERMKLNRYAESSAQPGLSVSKILELVAPAPPTKAEQEAIAEALSDADGLVESLEQLIAKKRQIKQGAMQELLTGKRRLPGFEGEWKSLGLGESATLKARIGWQGLTTAEYRNSGEYYLVTGTEFRNGNVDWSRCHFVSAHRYSQDPYIQIKSNDVLVTKDGTIGKVALVRRLPKPATLNSGVFVIRPKEKAFDPSFFFYLLCSSVFVDFLNQLSAGSTINHLYQKDFVKFVFAVPPKIKEQTAIATILSDMDAEITELEVKLTKVRKVKQGMMQELLTGSIRLPLAQGCSELKESANKPKHNQHFEDAVIIGTLAGEFGTPQYPVSRKRYTKLSYLLHRYHEQDTSAYLKKAAGPYNPTTRYGGAEKIAQKNGYACQVTGKYKGFVAGENVGQAQEYFLKWYGPDALRWLEQFRYAKSDEFTGEDKTVEVVVEIFNKVNSGGTKLSKGDLALAKICVDWPEARATMKDKLKAWEKEEFAFNYDWLLRSLNTVLTGEAKFQFLHDKSADEIRDGFKRATRHVETCLNLIGGRLGLDHDRVLFARFGIPVMVHYLDRIKRAMDEKERDKLLFWYVQAGMWGRFSSSTESVIDKDLEALKDVESGLDKLLEQLRLWHGGLRAEPAHFTGWSLGARFYPVLYLLTRMGESKDWGTGLPLKANLLGKMSKLEVHHIFPKAQLYKRNFNRAEVNALANFCFLTKDTNLSISDRLPEEYFPEIEAAHPGALASQWIPMDRDLWKMDRYLDFLEARKELLAAELNLRMEELLHGETHWLAGVSSQSPVVVPIGGISNQEEEKELAALNGWMQGKGLPSGSLAYDYADPETGAQKAIFDLAWPNGIQEELSQPVAVLLNETADVLAMANQAGFRCFTSSDEFKRYVENEIISEG